MTRVRKVAAVSLMTPMAAAAIAFGLGQPAGAAQACPPLASATINAPTGTVAVGATVHVSAQISGLMLLQAHLQATGPGLDQQVGGSVMSGTISGNVTVPKAGTYTLSVIGNGTKCTYKSTEFTAKQRVTPSPSHSSAPGQTPRPGGAGGNRSAGNGANPLPAGAGGNAAGGNYGLPLNGASPFSLPPVAPDGTAQGFAYPTPEPQVASPPPAQPAARSVAETTPIKWGQSLAIALVLLVISAHLGMWSRRQRLAAEGVRTTGGRGGGRRRAARKSTSESAALMTATATEPADAARDVVASAGAASSAGTADPARSETDREPGLTRTGSAMDETDRKFGPATADSAVSATDGEFGSARADSAVSATDREFGSARTDSAANEADSEPGHAAGARFRAEARQGDDTPMRSHVSSGRPADADTEPIATNGYADMAGHANTGDELTTATDETGQADDAPGLPGRPAISDKRHSRRSSGRGYQGRRRRD